MPGRNNEEETLCTSCRRPKTAHDCGICGERVCKSCVQFLKEGTFAFLADVPEKLSKTYYCQNCHDEHVAPALTDYYETMEKARQVFIFFTTQKASVPVLKKAREWI